MKNIFKFFLIGILFFSQICFSEIFFWNSSFAENLTEEEQLLEWQKVVAEMEQENENEKWIYFFDAIKNQIVKWFNYNDEFDSTSNPKLTEDWTKAIYSIWEWIFFKDSADLSFPNNEDLWVWDFWEININENSVKLFKTEIQWETLVLSWKDEDKFDWYVIQIKDKIDWFLDWDSKSLVYFLKKEWTDYSLDFWNNKNIILTEKIFEDSELKLFLNENFFYAKIFWVNNWKISTWSAQKILYWNTENSEPEKIWLIESLEFPILVDNYLKISDLVFTDSQVWDKFSWDFDWDEVFEKSWSEVFLPAQEDLRSFYINLKITKINWESFVKKIQLDYFSPKIFFDNEINWEIFWHIEPRISNFPVYYKYENEEIIKVSAKILTDMNWNFSFLKKSEKKSKEIYWEFWEKIWEIFFETWEIKTFWNFYLNFSPSRENFSSVWLFNYDWKYLDFFTKVADWIFENKYEKNLEKWKIFYQQIWWFENFFIYKNDLEDFPNLIRILEWTKTIAIISSIWEIKIYDESCKFIFDNSTKTSFDFFLQKNWQNLFYFNFWVDLK